MNHRMFLIAFLLACLRRFRLVILVLWGAGLTEGDVGQCQDSDLGCGSQKSSQILKHCRTLRKLPKLGRICFSGGLTGNTMHFPPTRMAAKVSVGCNNLWKSRLENVWSRQADRPRPVPWPERVCKLLRVLFLLSGFGLSGYVRPGRCAWRVPHDRPPPGPGCAPEESQVTNQVQHFVAHELIGKTQ